MLTLLEKALQIYVKEEQERIIEQEEYEMYRKQYPFDEYYYFSLFYPYRIKVLNLACRVLPKQTFGDRILILCTGLG